MQEVVEMIRLHYPAHLAKAEAQIRAWLNSGSACVSESLLTDQEHISGGTPIAASRVL